MFIVEVLVLFLEELQLCCHYAARTSEDWPSATGVPFSASRDFRADITVIRGPPQLKGLLQ